MGNQPIKNHKSHYRPKNSSSSKFLQDEGLLRISKTPFENCQVLRLGDETYFLEPTRQSLKEVLEQRMSSNRAFNEQEILKLIQNMSYTLAFLQNAGAPYPFLTPQNIFLCPTSTSTSYKLLPPQCIQQDLYHRFKQIQKQKTMQYVPASPQMVIAMRCRENSITEKEILYKSNVFSLGLLLLEVCTLKQSKDCFDLENYDILDRVVNQRIQEIQDRYSSRIVRIVANMLDYDYAERMDPKQLSIWINRELNEGHESNINHGFKHHLLLQNTEMIKSRLIEEPQNQGGQIQIRNKVETPSSKRLGQIRNKIMKQKIKAQKESMEEQCNLKKSGRFVGLSKSPTPTRNRDKERNMHNPYLNACLLPSPSTKKFHQTPQIPHISQSRIPNSRYLYIQTYEDQQNFINRQRQHSPRSGVSVGKNKDINLKYKYNMEDAEGESPHLSSNRKRDSQRYVRVEKCISEYQRAGLKIKNGYVDEFERGVNRSPDQRPYKDNYQQVSNFSFEPKKTQQNILKRCYPEQTDQSQNKRNQKTGFDMQKETGDKGYSRHQVFGQRKDVGRKEKQNQDILKIKKEIERSRKIIQEVRKNESQEAAF